MISNDRSYVRTYVRMYIFQKLRRLTIRIYWSGKYKRYDKTSARREGGVSRGTRPNAQSKKSRMDLYGSHS